MGRRGEEETIRRVKRALNSLQKPFPLALSRELDWRVEALSFWQLSRSSGRSIPISDGLGLEGAQGKAGNRAELKVEGVVGGGRHGDETLGGTRRFKPLHFVLPSAKRLMGDLSPVVLVNSLFMVGTQADLLESSPIGTQLVGRHPGRSEAVLL